MKSRDDSPNPLLAGASVAAIEVGEPALILEAAQVFGRRLTTAPKRHPDLVD